MPDYFWHSLTPEAREKVIKFATLLFPPLSFWGVFDSWNLSWCGPSAVSVALFSILHRVLLHLPLGIAQVLRKNKLILEDQVSDCDDNCYSYSWLKRHAWLEKLEVLQCCDKRRNWDATSGLGQGATYCKAQQALQSLHWLSCCQRQKRQHLRPSSFKSSTMIQNDQPQEHNQNQTNETMPCLWSCQPSCKMNLPQRDRSHQAHA